MFHEVLLAKIESFGILSLEFVIARHPYLASTLPKPARKAPCETTTPPFRLGGIRIAWSDGLGHSLSFDKHSNKEVRFWHGWR